MRRPPVSNALVPCPEKPRRNRTISLSMLAGLFGIAFRYSPSTDTIHDVTVQPARVVNWADVPDNMA